MGLFSFLEPKKSLQDSGVLRGTIDCHSHILFGVDDGVATVEESLAVLEYLESLGVKEIWCTPHIMEDVPNTTDFLKERFAQLCSLYNGPITLHLAAEYMLDTIYEARLKDSDLLVMEDDTVLVETSVVVAPYDLKGMLQEAMSKGYRPMFAHPERCRYLEVTDCKALHESGVRFQLNIASLVGYYGKTAKAIAEALLKESLYSAYGSDCHRMRTVKEQYARKELADKTIRQIKNIK